MPYSSTNGKPELLEIAKRFVPGDVLDLGCGSGTYAKLMKAKNFDPKHRMYGVEIWEPYVKEFDLHSLYADVYVMPAQAAAEKLIAEGRKFNLVLLGDMLEHLTRDDAVNLVNTCNHLLEPHGAMIISLPIGEYPQEAFQGNPYEAHLATWHAEDVMRDLAPDGFFQRGEIGVATFFKERERGLRMMAPWVTGYMICKNEEPFIMRCLESLLPQVDDVVAVDTGSTDKTVDILQDMAEVNPMTVIEGHISPWRFDDARNMAMSCITEKADLCISIDADELLEPGFVKAISDIWVLNLLAGRRITRFNHSFKTIWDWKDEGKSITQHYHERVHARFGYRWVHPVHEKLVSDSEDAEWCVEAMMVQKPDVAKGRPYIEPLRQAVAEDPKDWKLWCFLAAELEKLEGGYIDARNAYEQAIMQPGADEPWIRIQLLLLAERAGKPTVAKSIIAGAMADSNIREVHMYAGQFFERQGDLRNAAYHYELALEQTHETRGYMRNEQAWDGTLEHKLRSINNMERDE
jgi:2-polyprenyl-3-methyl-5-hydroxy-6-metoxy-1,4-benzoquinol methylase/glycosyltransferase involved in cell wall biosynthesis